MSTDPVGTGPAAGLATAVTPEAVLGGVRGGEVAAAGRCPDACVPGRSRNAPSPARARTVTTNASRRWPWVSSITPARYFFRRTGRSQNGPTGSVPPAAGCPVPAAPCGALEDCPPPAVDGPDCADPRSRGRPDRSPLDRQGLA